MTALLSLLEMERLRRPGIADEAAVRGVAAGLIDELGVREPPVDVEMVASMVDVARVHLDPGLDVAGCLVCGAVGAEIFVRASDPAVRRRFTVSHECSHVFFPGYQLVPQYRCLPTEQARVDDRLESLCDLGASELLLPRPLFTRAVDSAGFGLDALEGLADLFEASLIATGLRLIDLSEDPAALVTFEMAQSVADRRSGAPPKLRVHNAITRGRWPYFIPNKSVTVGDPFDRANQGEIVRFEISTITGICTDPVDRVTVDAQLYPYRREGSGLTRRVIALLRQVDGSRR